MRRLFDVAFASVSLLVLSPLLALIVVILRLTGEGEIFFRQERIGKDGHPFALLKFATMVKDSPNIGPGTITVKNDPRVLPFGRFLRRTKLNELAQLVNILKGDMSIIGPRPQTRRCFEAFPVRSQTKILQVRPGLSGVGSVVFREEEELMEDAGNVDALYDDVIMPYKGLLEEWYVAKQGLRSYFLLMFLTVWVVVTGSTRSVWRAFPDLPRPPKEIEAYFEL